MCEFTAHNACTNAEMNLKSATANGLNFRIINWLMEFWWGTLDLAWLSKHGLDDDDFDTPDSGRVLDSKKGFGFWILGSVLDSRKCFVFCDLCFAYSSICSTIKYLSWRSGFQREHNIAQRCLLFRTLAYALSVNNRQDLDLVKNRSDS